MDRTCTREWTSPNRDHRLLHGVAQVLLGGLLHLDENHGGNLLGAEHLALKLEVDPDHRLTGGAGLDFEGPQLDVLTHRLVAVLASDQPLGVEHGVVRVDSHLTRTVLHRTLHVVHPTGVTIWIWLLATGCAWRVAAQRAAVASREER